MDRFSQALPDVWRPSADYRIDFPKSNSYRDFLSDLGTPPASIGTRADLEAIGAREFERELLFGKPLPEDWPARLDVEQWAVREFWRKALRARGGSVLSFQILGRLAELIVRTNIALRRALTVTYSHVFLDEFQDTTHIQYELTRTIFRPSEVVVTAVGDNKQQIMRWAMAMPDPFAAFERDFGAVRTTLRNNYRSSPPLVKIQHVLAQAIDAGAIEAVAMVPQRIIGASCEIWEFPSPAREATTIARFIAAEMIEHNLQPRDFVLLVRQRAGDYMASLEPALAAEGIRLRNEAAETGSVRLQELLAEEISELVVGILRLATNDRAGRFWVSLVSSIAALRGIDFDSIQCARVERDVERFTGALAREFPAPPQSPGAASDLVLHILDFIGRTTIAAAYPAYRQGDWMQVCPRPAP